MLKSWAVTEGAVARPGGEAAGGAGRGPPARLRQLQRHHPRGPLRGRRGLHLGPRHLREPRPVPHRHRGDRRREARASPCTATSSRAGSRWCGCAGKGKRENWLLIKGKDEFATGRGRREGQPRRKAAAAGARQAPRRAPPRRPAPRRRGGGDHPPRQGPLPRRRDHQGRRGRVLPGRSRRGCCRSSRTGPSPWNGCPTGSARASRTSGRRTRPPPTPTGFRAWSWRPSSGKPVDYALVNDVPTLLYLVNQGTLTFHPWLSRVEDLDRPDFVLFDLDPGQAPFADVVAVARRLHDELDGRRARGVREDLGQDRAARPRAVAGGGRLRRGPGVGAGRRRAGGGGPAGQATVEIRKAKRGGRVYIDVLQNARGHHAVPPYVLRAVPGATVSTPLRLERADAGARPGHFHLEESRSPGSPVRKSIRWPGSSRRSAVDTPRRRRRRVEHGRLHRDIRLELRPLGGRALPAGGVEPRAAGRLRPGVPDRGGEQHLLPLAEGRGLLRPGTTGCRRGSSSRPRRRGA